MGRIQKKKDPGKKKALRQTRVEADNESRSSVPSASGGAIAAKPASVLKKPATAVKPKAASQDPNFVQKSVQFLREVKIELKKVAWPSKKQTIGSTVVVLILVFIISLFLGLVDFGLSSLIRAVLP